MYRECLDSEKAYLKWGGDIWKLLLLHQDEATYSDSRSFVHRFALRRAYHEGFVQRDARQPPAGFDAREPP